MTVAQAGENGIAGGAPLAAVRERLAHKQVNTTEDIELPGALEGELAVRYHALGYERAQEIAGRDRSGPRAGLAQRMDELINACTCILVREGDKWVELAEGGVPVRFDGKLAAALGIPDRTEGDAEVDTHVILRGVF